MPAFKLIKDKLALLKYPSIIALKSTETLTFQDFSKIVHFLEDQFICQLDPSERVSIAPVTSIQDSGKYVKALNQYLFEGDLNVPNIFSKLINKIVPPASPSVSPVSQSTPNVVSATVVTATPTKLIKSADEVARLQLLSFIIGIALQYAHSDAVDAKSNQDVSDSSKSIQNLTESNTQQHASMNNNDQNNNNNTNIQLFVNKATPIPFDLDRFIITSPSSTWDGPIGNVFVGLEGKNNFQEQINDELDKLVFTTFGRPVPNIHIHQVNSLTLYTTIPIINDNKKDINGNNTVKIFDVDADNEKNNFNLLQYIIYVSTLYAYTIPLTLKTGLYFYLPKSIHDIATQFCLDKKKGKKGVEKNDSQNDEKNNEKIKIEFGQESAEKLYILTKATHLMLLSTLREFNRRVQGEITTAVLGMKQFEPYNNEIIRDENEMDDKKIQKNYNKNAKNAKISLLSNDDAIQLNPSLLQFLQDNTPKNHNKGQSLKVQGQDQDQDAENQNDNQNDKKNVDKNDQKNKKVQNAKAQNPNQPLDVISITMPSHIFPSGNANPNANANAKVLKATFNTNNNAKTDNKNNKNNNNKNNNKKETPPSTPTAVTSATPVSTDVTDTSTGTTTVPDTNVQGNKNETMPVVKKNVDLKKIVQYRLNKEQFATRNPHVTNFITGRYHLGKLILLSSLNSKNALYKLSTLATAPLGVVTFDESGQKNDPKAMGDNDNKVNNDDNKDKLVEKNQKNNSSTLVNDESLVFTPQLFMQILQSLVRMLYDQELQQQQAIITRWINYLQTFTAREKPQ